MTITYYLKSNTSLQIVNFFEQINKHVKKLCLARGIDGPIAFSVNEFQICVNQEGCFTKGLTVYLQQLKKQLDEIIQDQELKCHVFQLYLECASLVLPNTSAHYSTILNPFYSKGASFVLPNTSAYYEIIPNDLKRVLCKPLVKGFNTKIEKQTPQTIKPLLTLFFNHKYHETLPCLVASCLSDGQGRTMNQMNRRLVDEQSFPSCFSKEGGGGQLVDKRLVDEKGQSMEQADAMRPRFLAAVWISKLARIIARHLCLLSSQILTDNEKSIIQSYSLELAIEITSNMRHQKLFTCYPSKAIYLLSDARRECF